MIHEWCTRWIEIIPSRAKLNTTAKYKMPNIQCFCHDYVPAVPCEKLHFFISSKSITNKSRWINHTLRVIFHTNRPLDLCKLICLMSHNRKISGFSMNYLACTTAINSFKGRCHGKCMAHQVGIPIFRWCNGTFSCDKILAKKLLVLTSNLSWIQVQNKNKQLAK